jgi:hypothetical protein
MQCTMAVAAAESARLLTARVCGGGACNGGGTHNQFNFRDFTGNKLGESCRNPVLWCLLAPLHQEFLAVINRPSAQVTFTDAHVACR